MNQAMTLPLPDPSQEEAISRIYVLANNELAWSIRVQGLP